MPDRDDVATLDYIESHIEPAKAGHLLDSQFIPGSMSTSSNARQEKDMWVELILFTPDVAEPTQFLSEEDYPTLARIWDNKDDDIFDSM